MKKLFFAALAAAVMSLGLISCDTDDPAEGLNVNTSRTAEFRGVVLVNANETASYNDQKWSAPDEELNISARVSYSQLGFGNTGGYYTIPSQNITYVRNTGEYTIISPVGLQGSSIEISIDNFKGSVKKYVSGEEKNVEVIWNGISNISTDKGYEGSVIYVANQLLSGSYNPVVNSGSNIN